MNNRWNRIVYRLYAPVYDRIFSRLFAPGRTRAIELIELQPGERVGLIGIGTGIDLDLLPADVTALGLDLSTEMLTQALPRAGARTDCRIALIRADAHHLPLRPSTLDVAVCNLVLSVVPDPVRTFNQTITALRPGGRVIIFDKFVPNTARVSLFRRLANLLVSALGTDINRRLGDIIGPIKPPVEILRDEPSIMRGMYRVILMRKP